MQGGPLKPPMPKPPTETTEENPGLPDRRNRRSSHHARKPNTLQTKESATAQKKILLTVRSPG